MTVQVGDTFKFDFQSDVFEGEYIVVEKNDDGTYVCEYVLPSDELIARAEKHYLTDEHPDLGYVDPRGPGRRRQTRQEALDEEIMRRIDRAGKRFSVKFVSQREWAEAF